MANKSEGWATHMYPLITCVLNTKGPVLELGCGWYSTPMLHGICKLQDRDLWSWELEESWLKKFRRLEGGSDNPGEFFHSICHVESPGMWGMVGGNEEKWSVIFIDHSPAERRQVDIVRLKDSCEFMVVHDTDKMKYYGYNFSMFKYKYVYTRFKKTTTILSQTRDPKELFE